MLEPILIVNAGSSSLKFSVFETGRDRALLLSVRGEVQSKGGQTLRATDGDGKVLTDEHSSADANNHPIDAVLAWYAHQFGSDAAFRGVGHRIVHGGEKFTEPTLIDDSVLSELQALVPLAPLHEPAQIAAIHAVRRQAPGAPQVACFDTSFHAVQPPIARQFALPREYSARGVRRYGFHGLSYEYIVSALPAVAPQIVDGRLIVAHLGNGASMCAISRRRSVATTMGMTALDGLPMGTRCGALDPGVLLYLMQHEHLSAAQIEQLLYERSGLLGVSGLSADMRDLLGSSNPAAQEAVDLMVYRIGRELGSLMAALGGLDALIFTGGIGEHAHELRARVCRLVAWAGVELDEAANVSGEPQISYRHSRVSAWVIPTDENLMVARHTQRLLDAA
jgi:acetate kinase